MWKEDDEDNGLGSERTRRKEGEEEYGGLYRQRSRRRVAPSRYQPGTRAMP